MAAYDTDAVVLRSIRYSEADAVLALYTRERGRASAIVKGARRTTSRLGGRLQPGVCARVTIHEGRGDLGTVRGGLGGRRPRRPVGRRPPPPGRGLRARDGPAGHARGEANEEAWHLLARTLDLLARAPAPAGPARLDPLVLGCQAKLLVVSGLLPMLGALRALRRGAAAAGLLGGRGRRAVRGVRRRGRPGRSRASSTALAALVGRPLAEAREALPHEAAPGVERLVGLVLQEHLGVRLRSAAPL